MPPLRRGLPAWSLLFAALAALPAAAQAPLSLGDALARTAAADPSRAAAVSRTQAAQAAVRAAAVRPQPTLSFDVENFGGTGNQSLFDSSETTLTYSQAIERSDKRDARTGQARAQAAVVALRAQIARLDLLRDAQTAYAEAQAAEAVLTVAEDRVTAALRSQADIDRRVASARDPLFAGSRAATQTAQARIARDAAAAAVQASRAALAAYWTGAPEAPVSLADFFDPATPAAAPAAQTPDIALLAAERDAADAAVRFEQTRLRANPTLQGGLRHFGAGNDLALVVGAAIPLGAAAANRANVERAQAERNAAEQDIAAATAAREREIARTLARLSILAAEARRIDSDVIPRAQQAVDQVTAGFNRGGFQYIDVTEAQRALIDARARRIEVLREHHLLRAALDRLTGAHLTLITLERP